MEAALADDLESDARAMSMRWGQLHSYSLAIAEATWDGERGSLSMVVGCGCVLVLAVDPQGFDAAENIVAMVQLENCRCRLSPLDSRLQVVVMSCSWTYSVHGIPALSPVVAPCLQG